MLPVKLVRSLILGEPINAHHHCPYTHDTHHDNMDQQQQHPSTDIHDSETITSTHKKQIRRRRRIKHSKNENRRSCEKEEQENEEEDKSTRRREMKKTPLILFMPSKELVFHTYRLASLARDIGMDLHPTPSLSHIIFTFPSPSSSSSSSLPSPSSSSSSWSTTSLSSSLWSLPNDAVPLPFPNFTTSPSLALLRSFVGISKGLFKLVFVDSELLVKDGNLLPSMGNWDCCSSSLFSRVSCERIDTMDGFSRALAGLGWTLFKTRKSSAGRDVNFSCGNNTNDSSVYLFRKVDSDRVRLRSRGSDDANSGSRVRELRLPRLDFRNAPLRILQYIILMTDDAFYIA